MALPYYSKGREVEKTSENRPRIHREKERRCLGRLWGPFGRLGSKNGSGYPWLSLSGGVSGDPPGTLRSPQGTLWATKITKNAQKCHLFSSLEVNFDKFNENLETFHRIYDFIEFFLHPDHEKPEKVLYCRANSKVRLSLSTSLFIL